MDRAERPSCCRVAEKPGNQRKRSQWPRQKWRWFTHKENSQGERTLANVAHLERYFRIDRSGCLGNHFCTFGCHCRNYPSAKATIIVLQLEYVQAGSSVGGGKWCCSRPTSPSYLAELLNSSYRPSLNSRPCSRNSDICCSLSGLKFRTISRF